MDGALVASEYASHLTDADLRLLASVARGGEDGSWLRGDPGTLARLLGDPRVFDAVFAPAGDFGEVSAARSITASPFLTFAVAVHRSAAELASVDHMAERAGPRQRVPLFDVPDLRDFLGSPARRLFLGARWYRAACHLAPLRTARLDVVGEVADRFRQARRVLNHIADQYLFGTGSAWFAPPAP
jgi:hypothetical protein